MEEQVSMEAFLEDESTEDSEPEEPDTTTTPVPQETPSEDGLPCCPWCLEDSDNFVDMKGITACGGCDARIPLDAEWYQDGEKILI